jgi:hypothetical protein
MSNNQLVPLRYYPETTSDIRTRQFKKLIPKSTTQHDARLISYTSDPQIFIKIIFRQSPTPPPSLPRFSNWLFRKVSPPKFPMQSLSHIAPSTYW